MSQTNLFESYLCSKQLKELFFSKFPSMQTTHVSRLMHVENCKKKREIILFFLFLLKQMKDGFHYKLLCMFIATIWDGNCRYCSSSLFCFVLFFFCFLFIVSFISPSNPEWIQSVFVQIYFFFFKKEKKTILLLLVSIQLAFQYLLLSIASYSFTNIRMRVYDTFTIQTIIILFFLVFLGIGPGHLLYVKFKCTIQKNSSEEIKELKLVGNEQYHSVRFDWAQFIAHSTQTAFGNLVASMRFNNNNFFHWIYCCCFYCSTIQIYLFHFPNEQTMANSIIALFRLWIHTKTSAFNFDFGLQLVFACIPNTYRWVTVNRCKFCDNKILGIILLGEWRYNCSTLRIQCDGPEYATY